MRLTFSLSVRLSAPGGENRRTQSKMSDMWCRGDFQDTPSRNTQKGKFKTKERKSLGRSSALCNLASLKFGEARNIFFIEKKRNMIRKNRTNTKETNAIYVISLFFIFSKSRQSSFSFLSLLTHFLSSAGLIVRVFLPILFVYYLPSTYYLFFTIFFIAITKLNGGGFQFSYF